MAKIIGKPRIRGQINTLVVIILVTVFLIAGIFVVWKIYGGIKAQQAKQICKDSLQFSSIKLNGLLDKFGNPVEIKCETEYVNINSQDDAEIEKKVADKMIECWDLFSKGEKEIFNTKDNTYCVACSVLSFDKETTIPKFSTYLNTNLAPYKDMTYLEYLSGISVDDFQETVYDNTELDNYDSLSTEEPLAVMFVMGKNAYPDSKIPLYEGGKTETSLYGAAGGTALGLVLLATVVSCPVTILTCVGAVAIIGGAAGGAIGYSVGSDRSADWDANVVLWPYSKINDMGCTYMEGKAGKLEIVQQ